jgi:hypothetical protein
MWKVLIYDSIGQSILAPIFSVKELRESGVTLHISLHSERYKKLFKRKLRRKFPEAISDGAE